MLINKRPALIVLLALSWALIADPLITLLARRLEPQHQYLFRSTNYFIIILASGLLLYRYVRKQQSGLRRGAEEYQRLFRNIPAPMYVYDRQSLEFLAVNDAAIQRYGYTYDEFLKMKATDIRPEEDADQLKRIVSGLPDAYTDAGRWRHMTKAGEMFYVRVYAHLTVFENRESVQVVAIDIDKKIKTELALKEKTAELENVLESITDAFYTVDKDWRFTYMNGEYERVQHRKRSDLLGKVIWDEFPYAAELRFYTEYHRAMAEQVSVHFEEYNPSRDMWVTANAYPTANGLAIYFRDITEEKRIREQIYLDDQNLRAIINNTSDVIWSVDKDYRIITGNDSFRARVAELTGKPVVEVTNDDFDARLLQSYIVHYRHAFTGEAFSTVRQQTDTNGQLTYQQLSFNPIYDQQQVIGVNCFVRDITEQQEHVKRIEKQNKQLREIAWIQSHLVRAPVASILGLVQLFNPDDSPNAEIIPMLKKSAEDLDQVILNITGLTDDLV